MKLHSQSAAGLNTITAYGADHIAVNGQLLRSSIIVTPDRLVSPWSPRDFDALDEAAMSQIAELACSIVLLGTGLRQRFPRPILLRSLVERQIGVEVMDSGAACRTYNILATEGRSVAAAILLESAS